MIIKTFVKFNYKNIGPKPVTLTKTIHNMLLSEDKLSSIPNSSPIILL